MLVFIPVTKWEKRITFSSGFSKYWSKCFFFFFLNRFNLKSLRNKSYQNFKSKYGHSFWLARNFLVFKRFESLWNFNPGKIGYSLLYLISSSYYIIKKDIKTQKGLRSFFKDVIISEKIVISANKKLRKSQNCKNVTCLPPC